MTESNQSTSAETSSVETIQASQTVTGVESPAASLGENLNDVSQHHADSISVDNEILDVLGVLAKSDAADIDHMMMLTIKQVDSIITQELTGVGSDDDSGETIPRNAKTDSQKESKVNEFDINFDKGKFLYKTEAPEETFSNDQDKNTDSIIRDDHVSEDQHSTETNHLFWKNLQDDESGFLSTLVVSEDENNGNYFQTPSV